ncbi:MAG: type III-A CRISPR-associated RAMP protein Csm3 [Syntrophomonadaceae bacterium]|nr:type III-A CRISPR-associated RAMP protein Csm3 [Syntrophomonadaceae bacterium]
MPNYAGALRGKLKITATLKLLTGLHIGASNDFSSIGAVDSVVVRDPLTRYPIIPGSSLKGKFRSLLARNIKGGPFYDIKDEPIELKRLFGGETKTSKDNAEKRQLISSRLQFFDIFLNKNSAKRLEKANTDLYLTEIKFENTISRLTGEANPRQLERVPARAEFDFFLVYNIEEPDEVEEDFEFLATGFKLLQLDYLGRGGTRGNGRVALYNFKVEQVGVSEGISIDVDRLAKKLEETKDYALLHV